MNYPEPPLDPPDPEPDYGEPIEAHEDGCLCRDCFLSRESERADRDYRESVGD